MAEISNSLKHQIELAKKAIALREFKQKEQDEIRDREERQTLIDRLQKCLTAKLDPDVYALLRGDIRVDSAISRAKFVFTVNSHEYWLEVDSNYENPDFAIVTDSGDSGNGYRRKSIKTSGSNAAEAMWTFIAENEEGHERRDAWRKEQEIESRKEEDAERNPVAPPPRTPMRPNSEWFVSPYITKERDLELLLNDLAEAGYKPQIFFAYGESYTGWYVVAHQRVNDEVLRQYVTMAPEAGQ